jgi:hypothetical protein
MEDLTAILKMFVAGGILGALLNWLFHHLSLQRQYRQALDQKVIERISVLVEDHYAHISSASEGLRDGLNCALAATGEMQKIELTRQICFYDMLTYLHQMERLTQKRPKPLLAEIAAEMDYVGQINKIYDGIPFGYYDISYLLDHCRRLERLVPVHEFVDVVVNEAKVKTYYDGFCAWLDKCAGVKCNDKNCKVHQVKQGCRRICEILENQTKKMYRLWYERRKKRPREERRTSVLGRIKSLTRRNS